MAFWNNNQGKNGNLFANRNVFNNNSGFNNINQGMPMQGKVPQTQRNIFGGLKRNNAQRTPMQGQMPFNGQMPMQGQMPLNGQMPMQGQMPLNGQMPMQGQMPPNGQMPVQGQIPPTQGQTPPNAQMPVQTQPPSQNTIPGNYKPLDNETMNEVQKLIKEKIARDSQENSEENNQLTPIPEIVVKPPTKNNSFFPIGGGAFADNNEGFANNNAMPVIDTKTSVEEIKLEGNLQKTELTPPPEAQYKHSNEFDSISIEEFKEIIQNEKNASEFYKILSSKATNPKHKSEFDSISGCCADCCKSLNKMHKTKIGVECEILNRRINDRVDFFEGLLMAMEYENRAIRELSGFMCSIGDANYKLIQRIINKKQCCFNAMTIMAFELGLFKRL